MTRPDQLNSIISCPSPLPAICILIISLLLTPVPGRGENTIFTIAADGGGTGVLANTLPAITLAAIANVDFIELDIVATSDNKAIVYSSPLLDHSTDVSIKFPDRARRDGHWYAIDFSLDEIRQLRRTSTSLTATSRPSLGIATLAETLSLLRTLENDLDVTIGIAPFIVAPRFHRQMQKDISTLLLNELDRHGYTTDAGNVFIQSLNGDELQRLSKELFPQRGVSFPLIQAIQPADTSVQLEAAGLQPYDHSWMFTRMGLRVVQSYADGIALHTAFFPPSNTNHTLPERFIEDVKGLGMELYVFPVTADHDTLPDTVASHQDLLDYYCNDLAVTGLITNSYRSTLSYLQGRQAVIERQHQLQPLIDSARQQLDLQRKADSGTIFDSGASQ